MHGTEAVIGQYQRLEMEEVELLLEQSSPTRLSLALNAIRLGALTACSGKVLERQRHANNLCSSRDPSNSQLSWTLRYLPHSDAPHDTCNRALSLGTSMSDIRSKLSY